jgi:hypothetical protein
VLEKLLGSMGYQSSTLAGLNFAVYYFCSSHDHTGIYRQSASVVIRKRNVLYIRRMALGTVRGIPSVDLLQTLVTQTSTLSSSDYLLLVICSF